MYLTGLTLWGHLAGLHNNKLLYFVDYLFYLFLLVFDVLVMDRVVGEA